MKDKGSKFSIIDKGMTVEGSVEGNGNLVVKAPGVDGNQVGFRSQEPEPDGILEFAFGFRTPHQVGGTSARAGFGGRFVELDRRVKVVYVPR